MKGYYYDQNALRYIHGLLVNTAVDGASHENTWCRTSCVECSRDGGLDVGGRAWNIPFKDAVQQPELDAQVAQLDKFPAGRTVFCK